MKLCYIILTLALLGVVTTVLIVGKKSRENIGRTDRILKFSIQVGNFIDNICKKSRENIGRTERILKFSIQVGNFIDNICKKSYQNIGRTERILKFYIQVGMLSIIFVQKAAGISDKLREF